MHNKLIITRGAVLSKSQLTSCRQLSRNGLVGVILGLFSAMGRPPMSTLLDFAVMAISAIPILIAVKRKHANITLIALLSLFSITIVGWIAAMAWAIWGRSDPDEYAKQSGRI
jgi:hypothetical protein